MAYVIGVDVGGTFTDAVLDDDAGTVLAAKSPSTPPDYSRGVMDALELLAGQLGVSLQEMLAGTHHIAHGTTSSLNALVTGNVPPVGFLTTKGHRDSIFIMNVEGRYLGRAPHELQNVLGQAKDHALLPKRHALEVTERIDRDGTVIVGLDEDQARAAIRALLDDGIRAIAVSLLWSFRNPAHERRLRELVAEQDPDVFVALSSEVSPRIREFSRNATTIMSTQIGPGLRDYLTALEDTLRENRLTGPLLVMQSNGGAVAARRRPRPPRSAPSARSSPAGWSARSSLGRQLGHRNIISTDVGGTTFLAGLIVDGEPVRDTTTVINHHPINVPTLRVDAIGSGGGAIAWLDPGGNLRVGPRSAQAVPGPACYGNGGTEPTNTDANLVLGILPERGLLGWPQAAVAGAGPAGHRHANRQAARPVRGARPPPRSTRCRTRRPATCCARPSWRPATTRATSCCTPSAGPVPRTAPATPPRSGSARSWSRSARSPPRSRPSAWRPPTSCWPPSCPIRSIVPFDPARAEQNFADLEKLVREGLDRQGVRFEAVEVHREIDMRYTLQLAEVTAPVAGRPAGRRGDRGRGGRLRAALRRHVRRGHRLPRGRDPGHHLPRPRHRGAAVLPGAARDRGRLLAGPGRRAERQPPGLPRRRPRIHRHCRSTTTAGSAPGTRSPAPRSSRSRPPPWSSRAAPPRRWTRSAT